MELICLFDIMIFSFFGVHISPLKKETNGKPVVAEVKNDLRLTVIYNGTFRRFPKDFYS